MNPDSPFVAPDLMPALPEIWLLFAACAVLIADLFIPEERRTITFWLTIASVLVAIVLVIMGFPEASSTTFGGLFVHDAMSAVLKVAMLGVGALALMYSRDYLQRFGLLKGEYCVLALMSMLGMMVMASAGHLLSAYLGLELLSLSLYAMVAFDRDNPVASEVAMKYFVLGAIASGLLLYGMSLVYGVTGTLDLATISATIAAGGIPDAPLMLALGFMVVGVAFKLGAVPFHMWVPDVYHGSPTAVTLFVGTAPKIAGFALIVRLLVDGLGPLHADWQQLLVILAILSMAIGNVVAIAQTNIKRMLAYSAISHMGFLLLGVLAGTPEGLSAAMFYAMVYALMSAGGFGMVILLSRKGFEADQLDHFRGLNQRSPWFAAMMLIFMASMSGLPPMLGFYAKLSVLSAVVAAGLTWVAIVAVLFAIIGAYYYLRVIKLMYFDEAEDEHAIGGAKDFRVLLSANGLAILGLGVFPGLLLGLCATVFLPL